MTSVFCIGTEEYLVNCSAGLDTTGASHFNDAGVVCFPTEGKCKLLFLVRSFY